MTTRRLSNLLRHNSFWLAVMVAFVLIITTIFVLNRYVPVSQGFGPVERSTFGGEVPFRVLVSLQCGSQDGSYLSDVSDVYCKVIAKSETTRIPQLTFSIMINNSTTNKNVLNCTGTLANIGPVWESSALCQYRNSSYFELPKGDYKLSIQRFSAGGIQVTKAEPVVFRGDLHVMSEFDKRLRQSEDGSSMATFLAFLFIIPTTILTFRSWLMEKHSQNNLAIIDAKTGELQLEPFSCRNSPVMSRYRG